ncbi:unnamed protein product [Cylindrotheca closterium]|uniref:Uncharacterized protein n=1 Tax=Cylindrotheca closterium TaxID=2856 RepID=A0AAD2FLR7_9STRA|nr:unnamed protein product [Cylindrotheca closterium]
MNSYRLIGPTTVHLEQEFYQLVAMLFLTLSSLRGLHQEVYWGIMPGDFRYVFLVGLWLGRNILIRWICTSDQSTHKSPSLKGVIAHWLCSLFVGGQYFNRPSPEAVAKQLGTHHVDNGRIELMTVSDFLFPSILYTWHTIKVRIVFPFLEARDSFLNRLPNRIRRILWIKPSDKTASDSKRGIHRSASTRLKLSRLYAQYRKRWGRYVPPAQILPILLFVLLVYHYFFSLPQPPQDNGIHALTMNTRATNVLLSGMDSLPYGGYKKLGKPSWALVLLLMSIIGTSATILLYGRVFLPIGDLAEGGNVLKAIRNEFKPNHQQHQTGHGSGKSKSKNQKEIPEPVTWPENYVSVATENRFRLLSKSISIRIIENLVVCALFPRTHLISRFTGNCPKGMPMSQLARVLYPAGVVAALRSDSEAQSHFVFVNTERGAMIATVLSVILITLSSLLTQGATLNRAYFATMGYLAGGWTIVSQSHPAARGKSKPLPWDSRKQYKKGDLISQQFPGIGTQTLYMATTDQPEGKPFDLSLRVVHDTFRNEHCHPANSDLIKFLVQIQLNMIVGLMVMIVCYHIVGVDCGSLRWILLGNLTAAYGTISSTRTSGLSEIQNLAQEISGPPDDERSEQESESYHDKNDEDDGDDSSGEN